MNEWYICVDINFPSCPNGSYRILCRVCANHPSHREAKLIPFTHHGRYAPRCYDCFRNVHGYGYGYGI